MSSFRRIREGDQFPVSATLYVTFTKCPQQALARVQGVYPAPSMDLFRGLLAHRIFARHLVDGPIEDDDFAMVCRQEAGAHLGGTMATLAMKPSDFQSLTDEIGRQYDRFKRLPTDGFDDAEVDIETEPVPGVRLRGRVDAVFSEDDRVRIVDWKTGSYLDDAEAQMEFYAMLWSLANGELPTRLEAISLGTGEKRVVVPTDDGVGGTEEAVAAMIEDLRVAIQDRSELPRTAGPHCRWCPLLDECSEGQDALEILK